MNEDIHFFDDDAVIRLGEAILSQLQVDYIHVYKVFLVKGPTALVGRYGYGKRKTADEMLDEYDRYIRSSNLTAGYSEEIIKELRRQGEAIAANGTNARKVNHRKFEEPYDNGWSKRKRKGNGRWA